MNVVGSDAAIPDEERHGLADVDAHLYGGQMVGEYSDADGLVPGAYLFIYRSDEALVEVFNGLELQFEVAVVAGFVAGFNVNEDEVVVTKGIDGGLCLTLVVGVGKACGAFYLNDFQAGIVTDTADKVDGGDDRSTLDLGVLLL